MQKSLPIMSSVMENIDILLVLRAALSLWWAFYLLEQGRSLCLIHDHQSVALHSGISLRIPKVEY